MQRSRPIRNLTRIAKIAIIFIILFTLAFPAFGQIKKATGRVLQRPDDIATTRKGNFNVGDILGTALVSITVVNDAVPAHLLLKLRIDFGGTWDADYVQASLVKAMGANETFTFTNKDILASIGSIRTNDFLMSDTLITHTGINGVEDITNLKNMPEGTYSITLSASEITLKTASDINSEITSERALKSEQVDFKVVTIGSIGSLSLPTYDNLNLGFQVPEIPVYDDAKGRSTSSTKIDIGGPGVAYSATKNHLKSTAGSSSIKGYPSDTTNGYVSYDLASVPFRAGETYAIDIAFNDWNTPPAPITTKTSSVKFPTPRLSLSATATEPFRPVFSWSFIGTDYSDWVKEYRVYLNGRYIGMTTDDSYQVTDTLTPNTAYTWYVMPINKDGSNFFASTSSLVQNLTTKAHTGLEVKIDEPANNSILIKGEAYDFAGSATLSDGATESASLWTIGTETFNGMELSYTPSKRYPANSLSANLKVTDSLGLAKTSSSINLTVLDPAIKIAGPELVTVRVNTDVIFTLDTAATRDLGAFEWFVDGVSIGKTARGLYKFTEMGSHEVYVIGTAMTRSGGTAKTVQSKSVNVTVQGMPPVVRMPSALMSVALGNTLTLTPTITSDNGVKTSIWTIDGPDRSQTNTTGTVFAFKPGAAGEYTITLTVIDKVDQAANAYCRILVIEPVVSITSPKAGANLPLASTLTPVISAPNASRIVWFIGTEEVSAASFDLSTLRPGSFELYARAFWNTTDADGKVSEISKDSAKITINVKDMNPPEVTILFPEDGMVLKAGETYTFNARVSSASSVTSRWLVDDVAQSGAAYTIPAGTSKKVLKITHTATNADAISGSQSVSVNVVKPAVFLTAPTVTEYAVGAVIPISASVVDAQLSWIVDGNELETWDKTFARAGLHTVRAKWSVEAIDGSGSLKEFSGQSNEVALSIYNDNPPVITAFSPANELVREVTGKPIEFSVTATSGNTLEGTTWSIIGPGAPAVNPIRATYTYTFTEAGQFTVRAVTLDNRGLKTTKEWTVKIIKPAIAISYPASGTAFALNSVTEPVVTAQDLSSYNLILDGNTVSADFKWNTVAKGSHVLQAEGYYTVSSLATSQKISSAAVNFTVEDKTPPNFSIEGVKDGDRIIAGKQYEFVVTRPNNETIEWYKNGTLVSSVSSSYSYTPAAAEKDVSFRVVGKLNGISAEKTFSVKVVDPSISIVLPSALAAGNLFPSQTPIPLKVVSRDIDRVTWMVDLASYTGATATFTPGTHSISVRGFAVNVRLPNASYGEYEAIGTGTTMSEIVVADRITIQRIVAQPAALQVGETVSVNLTLQGTRIDELVKTIAYYVDGSVLSQGKSTTASISSLTAGRHVIKATVTDVFGNASSSETSVTIYQPLSIGIAQPADEAKFSPDTAVTAALVIHSGQYSAISWLVDGTALPTSNFTSGSLGKLRSGRHKISVNVTDPLGRVTTASVNVEVLSDFQLSLLSPAAGTESIVGTEISCMAGVDKFAGSEVNVSDAAQNITWYVNGRNTGVNGLSYKFTPETAGNQTIQARYEKGDMLRNSGERTIVVRDIAEPIIKEPVNGATITYAQGAAIALLASGEPGATFSWELDGAAVATGNSTSFNPNGISGQKQLKLITRAFGRTKEKLATINLAINAPPTLSFSAQAVQFTGDTLTWVASAFDVEDQNPAQPIEIFYDGVKLANGTPKVLRTEDIGTHTLMAKTTDRAGVSVTTQASIRVESNQLTLEIQSPMAGATFYQGFDILLKASLAAGSVDSTGSGTFAWTVQYLDDPSAAPDNFTGSSVSMRPKALGEMAATVKYSDGSGRLRGSGKVNVKVQREALKLGIYWPHGSVVNSGETLTPRLTGLPETGAAGNVTWALNGINIASIASFKAPPVPGSYNLTANYTQGSTTDRTEISFTVNGPPTVQIMNLASGGQYVAGSPLVLSARVDDDQPFAGTVSWKNQDGILLGEGNPFILNNPAAGELRLTASAMDKYGASGSATLPIRLYTPASAVTTSINNGLATYLVASDAAPLGAKADFTGGLSPVAMWTLRQADKSVAKTGREVTFGYDELSPFIEGPVVLSLAVSDAGLADEASRNVFRNDYNLTLARNAVAERASPLPGDVFWAGSPIPLRILLTGFAKPAFSMTMNGKPVTTPWISVDGARLYGTELPAALAQNEGVYELNVAVTENGTSRAVPFTLNVYAPRNGIFVDNAPSEIDLETGAGKVNATVSGLKDVDGIQWRTDMAASPVGTGTSLDLASIGLAPGSRSITVEALSAGREVSSFTFPVKVFGPMELKISPADEPFIVQKGATVSMTATAKDRDGSALSGAAITWTSHVDGLLGTGSSLDLGSIATLSAGEHVFTVMASGSSGISRTALRRVQVNIAAPTAPPPAPDGLDGQTRPGYTDTHPLPPVVLSINPVMVGFGGGNLIASGPASLGPRGPGGRSLVSSLIDRLLVLGGNAGINFFGGIGGGLGGSGNGLGSGQIGN